MTKSATPFARWTPLEPFTWSFQVFTEYDRELMRLWGSHLSSTAYTYSQLGSTGAKWTDKPSAHFRADVLPASFCTDMKDWSTAFNAFDNWVNLSVVLTLASNLETYVASVVRLALQSDPGVLLGTPRAIDGGYALKHKRIGAVDIDAHIEACTRGDWNSRLSALQRLFGSSVAGLRAVHSDLDHLRTVRNRFGHAFGRKINEARRTGTLDILPMEKMTRKTAERLRDSVLQATRSFDQELLTNHIGEYEAVHFYNHLHTSLKARAHAGQRAQDFKKAIGHHGAQLRGKVYCKGLVQYWDAL